MTALTTVSANLPAHIRARLGQPSALGESLSGGISTGETYPRISIKGARFRIVEGDKEEVIDSTFIDVIIVGANPALSKTYYAGKWDPDAEQKGPDCYSMDGVRPAADATNKQSDICATCRHAAWGSKVSETGKEGKACADSKRLAVVAADDPSGGIYLLQVTAAALKGLGMYQKELASRNIPPEVVRTRLSFDTTVSFPKLTFKFADFITEEEQNAIENMFGSDPVRAITGVSTVPAVQAIEQAPARPAPVREVAPPPAPPAPPPAPPAPAKRGFGAKAAAAPVATAVKSEPVAEPKKATKRAAPVAAVEADTLSSDIDDLISKLDLDDAG